MALDRLTQIKTQLSDLIQGEPRALGKIGQKNSEDIVIVSALRTPITKAKKGGLKDLTLEDMLAAVLRATLESTRIDPNLIEDVAVGNVLTGTASTCARMAAIYAGLPERCSVYTVNRQCSSGLQACVDIANAIHSGMINIGIGAGFESMTRHYGPNVTLPSVSEKMLEHQLCANVLTPIGITSENVAKKFNISREKQDKFALESHSKAYAAQQGSLYDSEIAPVTIRHTSGGKTKSIVVSKDDGIRPDTCIEKLKRLKPAFDQDGCTTAGNASQISDGAAAVLMMKRKVAEQLELPILGKYITASVVGVHPSIMGIGPAIAIPDCCKKAGIKISEVDIFEINESFASQAVYCIEALKIDPKKVNPKGGAIALGHPLGCTAVRQIVTLLPELKRQNKKIGAVSICVGTGMGMCAIFERE